MHAYADHSKVRRIFNGNNSVSLDEGIRLMANWVQGVGSKKSREFSNLEIQEQLPDGW
jgi:hypothetical protein